MEPRLDALVVNEVDELPAREAERHHEHPGLAAHARALVVDLADLTEIDLRHFARSGLDWDHDVGVGDAHLAPQARDEAEALHRRLATGEPGCDSRRQSRIARGLAPRFTIGSMCARHGSTVETSCCAIALLAEHVGADLISSNGGRALGSPESRPAFASAAR
jgi:hypothetical protein